MTRRNCIKTLATTGLAVPMGHAMSLIFDQKTDRDIYLFSKHLQWLDYNEMAKAAKQMGFDGVDLTVRPKGHVLPENVERDLPKAIEAIHKAGLKTPLITTGITNTNEPYTEKIIKTASQLGIKYYRMGWLNYADDKSIPEQLDQYKNQFKQLEQMNQHYNIHGAYQNHAGDSVGASVWDIWYLIKDLNPQWLGCRFDVRHAMVEGMNSWKLGLKLLHTHIHSLDLKDFQWKKQEGKWIVENMPIGQGAVDFSVYFQLLKDLKLDAPITLHVEYALGGANQGATQITIPPEQVFDSITADLNNIKTFIKAD